MIYVTEETVDLAAQAVWAARDARYVEEFGTIARTLPWADTRPETREMLREEVQVALNAVGISVKTP